jgi:hypothetical protein
MRGITVLEDEDLRVSCSLTRMRKAVLRCSYVNRDGASPMTTESYGVLGALFSVVLAHSSRAESESKK